MAQGKMKVKAQLPNKSKAKKAKGAAVTKRQNKPMKSLKKKNFEVQKLKQVISKAVNKSLEDEIRAMSESKLKLSKAQQAVAEHNSKS